MIAMWISHDEVIFLYNAHLIRIPAALNILDRFKSNKQLICAFPWRVFLPNFVSVRQGVRHNKLPTKLGRRKQWIRKTEQKHNGRCAHAASDHLSMLGSAITACTADWAEQCCYYGQIRFPMLEHAMFGPPPRWNPLTDVMQFCTVNCASTVT
jgi:hypothetical protein